MHTSYAPSCTHAHAHRLYAFCVILLIIGLVIGILGLIGWQLSIIESVIFACGVGMACDFVAHLGFAYRQANVNREASERTGLVEIAISRMMPAISAAALSTSVSAFTDSVVPSQTR